MTPDREPHHAWSLPVPTSSPAWLSDAVVQCLIASAVVSALFVALPDLDIWVSAQFYEPGAGFPVSRLPAFLGLRALHTVMTWGIALIVGAVILAKIAMPDRAPLLPLRACILILGVLAIGRGLIVNGMFKSTFGRPRPYQIDTFGGDVPFVPAWHLSNTCHGNCSFISAESSSGVWLVTAAILLPRRWRAPGVAVLLGLGVAFALNRVAFGQHFMSDVLIAWFLTLALIALFWRLLYVAPPPSLTESALDDAFASIGNALRRPFGGPKP